MILCNHHPYSSCNHKNANRKEEPEEPLGIVTEVATIIFLVSITDFLSFISKHGIDLTDMRLHLCGHPLAFFGKQFLNFLPVSIIDIVKNNKSNLGPILYDELKSAVKEIAEDFEWVCSKDGQIIMKIEDWIENARLRLGKEYPDVLIYIGRSFVNPKELVIGGVVNDDDEQKLFENYFNNQNPPVPIHFKIIVQNEE